MSVENIETRNDKALKFSQTSNSYLFAKRLFDIFAATFILILVSPLFLIIPILIKFDFGGSVIFRQFRIGINGSYFRILKFRTVKQIEADESINDPNHDWNLVTKPEDGRVSKLGRFMRKTSIDELPQLINVLKGEMSLVGPRPLVPSILRDYEKFNWARSKALPGITGLWQIRRSLRNRLDVAGMIPDDLEYIQKRNFLFDLWILLKTFPVVFGINGFNSY